MKKILIAAISQNNVIGKDGKVPWKSSEEIAYFKNSTIGSPIVMGRKTWESMGEPLKGRLNIVITRNENYKNPFKEVIIFFSYEQAINFLKTSVYEKVFIIGGGEIFKEALDSADEIYLSKMNFEAEGDVYFPEIELEKWLLESNEIYTDFILHHYIRKAD